MRNSWPASAASDLRHSDRWGRLLKRLCPFRAAAAAAPAAAAGALCKRRAMEP